MRALWCWSGSSIRVTGANLSTLQGVRRWLQGEAIPAQDKIQVLVEWLKVEPEVLRFGEAVRQSVKQHQQLWESGMGHWERETCEAFLCLISKSQHHRCWRHSFDARHDVLCAEGYFCVCWCTIAKEVTGLVLAWRLSVDT